MSGGSYDYVYGRIRDAAAALRLTTPERRAFQTLLQKVATAMHDIEWVDSGDCEPGDETPAIMACVTPAAVITAAVEEARCMRDELTAIIARYETP